MSLYVALLRGINVGGHKRMKMAELRELLRTAGVAPEVVVGHLAASCGCRSAARSSSLSPLFQPANGRVACAQGIARGERPRCMDARLHTFRRRLREKRVDHEGCLGHLDALDEAQQT